MMHTSMETIIDEVTEGIYRDYPALLEKFGERGRQKCREDNQHHIKHLQTAENMGDSQFFIDYAHWLNGILTSRGMKTEHLVDNFYRLQKAFISSEKQFDAFCQMLEDAIISLQMADNKQK